MRKILIIAMIAFTSVSFAEPDSGAVIESSNSNSVDIERGEKIKKIRTHINRRGGKYGSLNRMVSKYDLITNEQKSKMLAVGAVAKECLGKDKSQPEANVFKDESDFCKEFRARSTEKAAEILAELELSKEERRERLSDIVADDAVSETD